jgi:hypothetical protein
LQRSLGGPFLEPGELKLEDLSRQHSQNSPLVTTLCQIKIQKELEPGEPGRVVHGECLCGETSSVAIRTTQHRLDRFDLPVGQLGSNADIDCEGGMPFAGYDYARLIDLKTQATY